MGFLEKPKGLVTLAKNNFFLRRHHPSTSTLDLLARIYPAVDWRRVDFFEGLPWFTPLVAPYVTAQALPDFYSTSRFRIYLKKFDESRAQCVADIVHEGFHIMQAMGYARGYGLGFFRGFMPRYIAGFMKHGYRQHPFEIPAYDQEFRFMQACEAHGLHGVLPKLSESDVRMLPAGGLVFRRFDYHYKEGPLRLAAALLFCAAVTVLRPCVDAIVFFIRVLSTKGIRGGSVANQ